MIVFDKLWETMKAKHVSTYALRDRFDIDSRTIRRLRANQTVTTDTLDKLCRILDASSMKLRNIYRRKRKRKILFFNDRSVLFRNTISGKRVGRIPSHPLKLCIHFHT